MKLKCEWDPMSKEDVHGLIENLHTPQSNELKEISRIWLLLFYTLQNPEDIQLLGDVFWRIKNARMQEGNRTIQEIWDTYHQEKQKDPAFQESESALLVELVKREIEWLSYIRGLSSSIYASDKEVSELEFFARYLHDHELIELGERYGGKIRAYIKENHLIEIALNANLFIWAWIGRTIDSMTILWLAEDRSNDKRRFFIVADSDGKIFSISESEATKLIRGISEKIIQEWARDNKEK